MKLSLQSYFDLGFSMGLGDEVFGLSAKYRVPDISKVGISNPLGNGIVIDLLVPYHPVLDLWRTMAIRKVDNPDMELGFIKDPKLSDEEQAQACTRFKNELVALLEQHPFDRCELTIYAVGVVFVRLDHASGISAEFLQGFHKCYEFAAYSVDVSKALHDVARERALEIVEGRADRLRELSQRPAAKTEKDTSGYEESKLFKGGFSCIVLCIDPDDSFSTIMPVVRQIEDNDFKELVFDYHGKLHFGWAACIIEPRPIHERTESAPIEIMRMLQCVQIAHVFLATCNAFQDLFLQETRQQVDRYVKGTTSRSSTELNRLRTLALAIITLTQYAGVAEADEDQRYFETWEAHAKIKDRHSKIQQQCELLYNVQVAETQAEEVKRERILNRVVLFLTAFTLVSVLVDSYEFIDYKEGWFAIWIHRLWLLSTVIGAVAAMLTLVFWILGRSKKA